MLRTLACLFLVTLLAVAAFTPLAAAEKAPAVKKAEPKLTLATDEKAAKVLAVFADEWKAKGLKGDDKVSQRDYAMRKISKIHHPDVVHALGKASRNGDSDTRMLALIYLGDQKALPHLAGQHVLKALKKHKKDIVLQLTGLQTLGALKYLGARKEVRGLIKHKYFVVKKSAIAAVGRIGDKRMLADVLSALGVKLGEDGKEPDKKESKKETTEEGYSWEGAEATVDRGESDNTQENADAKKQAEAQIAKNKAAAASGKGGGAGGGAPGGLGGTSGRGGSSRSTEELTPTILRTLKALTGEEFDKPSSIRTWVKVNKASLESDCKDLDAKEKAQKAVGK